MIPSAAALRKTSKRVVLIGTSTGGPQALTRLLKAFPADFPAPIAIVLHIPAGYTAPLAERLNADCAIAVAEASDGLRLRPGLAILAQAGMHLRLAVGADGFVLGWRANQRLCTPAVDVLFESAALSPEARHRVFGGRGEAWRLTRRPGQAAGAEGG